MQRASSSSGAGRRARRLAAWPLACVSLLCACAALCAHAHVLAPPLISPPSTPPFAPSPPIDPSRTAFVSIHLEAHHDYGGISAQAPEASVQGIRTMMASLKDPRRGNTQRARVVLVPANTPAATRKLFEADGLLVLDMDDTLPHEDLCSPKMDRIYLWAKPLADRFDRVVYLDWDVIVQRPMDHLFLCGHHCMVFNSILHFVDGIMIVKPDPAVFERMVQRYVHERASHAWSPDAPKDTASVVADVRPWRPVHKTTCWQKSYLFFLFFFGNIEAAPLFKSAYGQSELPLQRLDASTQLNAMMWYEKYSWTLMRGKDYRNMSNDQEVPALSLGYTTLKPFHWGPALFFNLAWDWSDLRDEYLGVSHTYFIVSRCALWLLMLLASTKGIKKLISEVYRKRVGAAANSLEGRAFAMLRAAHIQLLGPTGGFVRADSGAAGDSEWVYVPTTMLSLPGYWLPLLGSDLLGVILGTAQVLLSLYFLTWYHALIPMLTAPHLAWRVWFMFHTLGVYAFNHYVFLAYHACPPLQPAMLAVSGELRPVLGGGASGGLVRDSAVPDSGSVARPVHPLPSYPLLSSIGWVAFWEFALYVMMRRTFYPEFVVKMFVMFPLFACILISAINVNRAVWRSVEASKDKSSSAANRLPPPGGVHLPMLPGSR